MIARPPARGVLLTVMAAAVSTLAPPTSASAQPAETAPVLTTEMLSGSPVITVRGPVQPPAPNVPARKAIATSKAHSASIATASREATAKKKAATAHVHAIAKDQVKGGGQTSGKRVKSARTAVRRAERSTAPKKETSRAKGGSNSASGSTSSTSVIDHARANLGIPYVWGGSTRAGFDCSGYTKYVFRAAGKSIPRTAESQRRAARRVSEPRPGDLVFIGFPAHHVGIYAGEGKMYHSPRAGKVTQKAKIWSKNVSYGRF